MLVVKPLVWAVAAVHLPLLSTTNWVRITAAGEVAVTPSNITCETKSGSSIKFVEANCRIVPGGLKQSIG